MPVEFWNVKMAGLGGQGVITSSDILAETAFRAGYDVKKSELHGMSQRGGSVSSDVRFGRAVYSPMIPFGEADFLLVLSPDQISLNLPQLKPGGVLIEPKLVDESRLPGKRSLNLALLGLLSARLPIPEDTWLQVIRGKFSESQQAANIEAFRMGRETGDRKATTSSL